MLGCGTYHVLITGRGGSPTLFDVPFSAADFSYLINQGGGGSVSVATGQGGDAKCVEILSETEPWRDEVNIYRDNDLVSVGPVISVSGKSGQIRFGDVFSWFEKRLLLNDMIATGDNADIFRDIAEEALSVDNSPSITVKTKSTGIEGSRRIIGVEGTRASDVLRELARTSLDFVVVGRIIYAGGIEVLLHPDPIIIHDGGIEDCDVTKEGENLVTDAHVLGGLDIDRQQAAYGRATRASDVYGVLQESFSELLIFDNISADANALAHVESMLPAPRRATVTLSPNADPSFSHLVPGARATCYITSVKSNIPIEGTMRLRSTKVNVSGGTSQQEKVELELVPLGVGNSEIDG